MKKCIRFFTTLIFFIFFSLLSSCDLFDFTSAQVFIENTSWKGEWTDIDDENSSEFIILNFENDGTGTMEGGFESTNNGSAEIAGTFEWTLSKDSLTISNFEVSGTRFYEEETSSPIFGEAEIGTIKNHNITGTVSKNKITLKYTATELIEEIDNSSEIVEVHGTDLGIAFGMLLIPYPFFDWLYENYPAYKEITSELPEKDLPEWSDWLISFNKIGLSETE